MDAAVVGNAFHWFDGPEAVAELARVLRPAAGLAVVWNIGLESDPPSPELEAYVAGLRERAGVAEATTPAWRDALDASDRFTPLAYHELHHPAPRTVRRSPPTSHRSRSSPRCPTATPRSRGSGAVPGAVGAHDADQCYLTRLVA